MILHGFYGKLPTAGDFVGRGWQAVMQGSLDALIQEALREVSASARTDAGVVERPGFSVISIRPGVLGEHGIVAVVMTSVDRVGRRFPLCAGVQWLPDDDAPMTWPSIEYGLTLGSRIRRNLEGELDPELLLSEIVAVGDPHRFQLTLQGVDSEDTMPPLPAETMQLHVKGPLASIPAGLQALCAFVAGASDLLGIRFDAGDVDDDFFVIRRLEDGGPLAALFDGAWSSHGWTTYGQGVAHEDPSA